MSTSPALETLADQKRWKQCSCLWGAEELPADIRSEGIKHPKSNYVIKPMTMTMRTIRSIRKALVKKKEVLGLEVKVRAGLTIDLLHGYCCDDLPF